MTTYHLFYDDAGHHLHYNPRDAALDLGFSLTRRSPMPYEGSDMYMPGALAGRQSLPNVPSSSFQFSDFIHDDPASFTNPWGQQHMPMYDGQGGFQPLARTVPAPLQEPAPIRPQSPHLSLSSTQQEPEQSRSQFLDQNAGSNSNMLYFPSAPSMFAPSSGSWTIPQQQSEPVPEPQPSWTMSGSLDPSTGVFQRAPEHPRVRTAQACEKCRARKAKCSGDHPTCQRCHLRGLTCEYAPERKMRGPNKVKRKSIAVSNAASRRASVVSSVGSSSDEMVPWPASEKISVKTESPRPYKGPSSPSSSTISVSPRSDAVQEPPTNKRLQKLRPPPIDLKRTSMFELHTQFLNHADAQLQGAEDADNRRNSLPTGHLISSQLENGFAGRDLPSQRPFSTQPYTFDNASEPVLNIQDRLAVTQTFSTPITPITTSPNPISFHRFDADQMLLPLDFGVPAIDPHDAHMAAVESHYGAAPSEIDSDISWPESMIDLDPTPTAGSNAKDKNLAQIGALLASEA